MERIKLHVAAVVTLSLWISSLLSRRLAALCYYSRKFKVHCVFFCISHFASAFFPGASHNASHSGRPKLPFLKLNHHEEH